MRHINQMYLFQSVIKIIFLLGLVYLYPAIGIAKNMGVIGTVYPIAEMGFIEWMQAHIQEKAQSGEMARWQAEQAKSIQTYADRPTPVEGLTPTLVTRSWLYDPTLTLQHDLKDQEGNIRLPAGSRINPLDHVTWTHTLLFYDGDNADQVAWAKTQAVQLKGQIMLILVRGSISQQTEEVEKMSEIEKIKKTVKPVYFDQGGLLVKKFGIQHIPASVYQEERKLKITEIKL
jgi:conjugal transfer pilus assembly protein TraW